MAMVTECSTSPPLASMAVGTPHSEGPENIITSDVSGRYFEEWASSGGSGGLWMAEGIFVPLEGTETPVNPDYAIDCERSTRTNKPQTAKLRGNERGERARESQFKLDSFEGG